MTTNRPDTTVGATSGLGAATVLTTLARTLAETPGVLPTLHEIAAGSVDLVPCDWAAVAVAEHFTRTRARLADSTDEALMETVAEVAAEAGHSPGLAAFEAGDVVRCDDLAHECRFTAYATQARRTHTHPRGAVGPAAPPRRHPRRAHPLQRPAPLVRRGVGRAGDSRRRARRHRGRGGPQRRPLRPACSRPWSTAGPSAPRSASSSSGTASCATRPSRCSARRASTPTARLVQVAADLLATGALPDV